MITQLAAGEYPQMSAKVRSRVLVIDGEDRVLLLLSAPNEIEPEPCWITPGGGVTPHASGAAPFAKTPKAGAASA